MVDNVVYKNKLLPYFLVLPQVVVTVIFFFWPAFQSLRLSLFEVSPFGDREFYVGLKNFSQLISSAEYLRSIINTIIFTLGVTLGCLFISLCLALLADAKIKGVFIYRTALLVPYGIAPPVAGIIWMFMFHPSYGVIPYLVSFIMPVELNWLIESSIAMFLVITTAVWTNLGYNFAFFLAGLQLIPESILEAATVDGADFRRKLRHVTLPMLSPVLFFLLVMNIIYALFNTFGVIHAITMGGPGGSTETMVYKAYKDGFIAMNLGSSATQSVILMAFAIILTVFQFHFGERKVHY